MMKNEDIAAKEDLKENIEKFFGKHFYIPRFDIPLKKLFPEPENRFLRSFWKAASHADIPVFSKRDNRLIAIFETGGSAHLEKKQVLRDTKKAKICALNNIGFRGIQNWEWEKISRRKFRNWIRKVLI